MDGLKISLYIVKALQIACVVLMTFAWTRCQTLDQLHLMSSRDLDIPEQVQEEQSECLDPNALDFAQFLCLHHHNRLFSRVEEEMLGRLQAEYFFYGASVLLFLLGCVELALKRFCGQRVKPDMHIRMEAADKLKFSLCALPLVYVLLSCLFFAIMDSRPVYGLLRNIFIRAEQQWGEKPGIDKGYFESMRNCLREGEDANQSDAGTR